MSVVLLVHPSRRAWVLWEILAEDLNCSSYFIYIWDGAQIFKGRCVV